MGFRIAWLALMVLATTRLGFGQAPTTIKVDVTVALDYVELAPAGNPPTFSALAVPRVLDPKTGKPYDRSNSALSIDPKDLRRTFRLESSDVLLGEPVLVEFRIELDGPGQWNEPVGGFGRGLGRDGRFFFVMRHRDGAWVPDIYEGHNLSSFGGPGGMATVERGQPQSSWHAVQQWCAIERPGVYDLYAFHWGGWAWGDKPRPSGLRQRVEAALPDAIKRRVRVDDEGNLVDPRTNEPPRDVAVVLKRKDEDPPDVSPIARSMPEALKARLPGAAGASDYAHFTLTVRPGDKQKRRAMVERWTGEAAGRGPESLERDWAATTAMALARQDDFLPELKLQVRSGDRFALQTVFLGLAMRDDPRAIDLLFSAGVPEALEPMRFLRPAQVPAAIPRLIDRLTDKDHVTRALAEEALRLWTGQKFGHTWEGYHHQRPTLAEGRTIQALYRSWWRTNQGGFRPRLH